MCAREPHPFSAKRRLVLTNDMKFSAAQIRYLICLCRLSTDGCGVRNAELSAALGLRRSSVHAMLRALSDMGAVTQEAFGLAHLTEEGRAWAVRFTVCANAVERSMTALCGPGALSEDAVCGVLADLPYDRLCALYGSLTDGR